MCGDSPRLKSLQLPDLSIGLNLLLLVSVQISTIRSACLTDHCTSSRDHVARCQYFATCAMRISVCIAIDTLVKTLFMSLRALRTRYLVKSSYRWHRQHYGYGTYGTSSERKSGLRHEPCGSPTSSSLEEGEEVKDVAIIGGGITGLASAHFLSKAAPNTRITLFESGDRLGGWLHSEEVDVGNGKVLFEKGPRTLRPTAPNGILTLDVVSSPEAIDTSE